VLIHPFHVLHHHRNIEEREEKPDECCRGAVGGTEELHD